MRTGFWDRDGPGKHCESLQRNLWRNLRNVVSPSKVVSLDVEYNALSS